jgi:hypothetical protein
LSATEAGRLKNLTYLLKKGTTIPCALKTGIDTQLPGFVLCNVVSDVYSANGSTLLIERGATMFGEQQSQLKPGQDRTFVIWSRIDNPSGVTVDIDSPATDAMGYSGVPGIVDRHFAERFGAAILLTTIKDFSRAVADNYSDKRGDTYIGGSNDSSMENMATEALKSTINIPPNLIWYVPANVDAAPFAKWAQRERAEEQTPQQATEKVAPRHDLNKNQAQMHVAVTARTKENIEALKKNPVLAGRKPGELETLAYFRGMFQETMKDQPQAVKDALLAKFDKVAEDPATLERLEKSESPALEEVKTQDKEQRQERKDTYEQSL